MNNLESYIISRFKKRRWYFFSMLKAKMEVGETFENDLRELKEKQMIRFRAGINGELIEMINLEKWKI